jgi:hypothetical protein
VTLSRKWFEALLIRSEQKALASEAATEFKTAA